MSTAPILFEYDGKALVPYGRFAREAKRSFEVGRRYLMTEHQNRSHASHNHYFASLTEGWQNLPEALAHEFPTEEHLRKFALIKAGYARKQQSVWPSADVAARVAALVKPIDTYAVVEVDGCVVTIWTAMSQSTREMSAKTFQASKEAVLDIVASMVSVDRATLHANAGSSA